MILLKSKNKIKRFGNKTDKKKHREQKQHKEQHMDLDSVIRRIQRKIDDHKKREDRRLEEVMGGSGEEGSKSKGKRKRKTENAEVSMKRTKSSEMEIKPQETVDSLRKPIAKLPLQTKSPRAQFQSPNPKSPKSPHKPPQQPPPRTSLPNTTTSKRRR